MFEKASRLKVRFDSEKGQLTVEDLWNLPLTSSTGKANLDDIARGLHKQLKNDDDVSFVVKERKSDTTTQLKFDIVKRIIDIKIAEKESQEKAAANKAEAQKILSLIADKQDEVLKGMTVEELKEMLSKIS